MNKLAMAATAFGVLIADPLHFARADAGGGQVRGYSQGSIGVGFSDETNRSTVVIGKKRFANNSYDTTDGKSLQLRVDLLSIQDGKYFVRSETEAGAASLAVHTHIPALLGGSTTVLQYEYKNLHLETQDSAGILGQAALIKNSCRGYAALSTGGEMAHRTGKTFAGQTVTFDNRSFSAGPELGLMCQVKNIGLMMGVNAEARLTHDDGQDGYSRESRIGLRGRANIADRALIKLDADRGERTADFRTAAHVKAFSGLPIYVGAEYEYDRAWKGFDGRSAGVFGGSAGGLGGPAVPDSGLETRTHTFTGVAGVAW